jgi:FMN-dependent NADH-azoreductase
MPTLLHIDSSPLGDASISRHLTKEFVQHWKKAHPAGRVINRDLTIAPPGPVTGEWVGAAYTPESARTAQQNEVLSLSDTLIGELFSADEYVFGVPMHNFSIPSTLKLWIDQIARVGKTFNYVDGKPVGLLKNKKATFVLASGGSYDAGTAMASYNFVEPYLRTIFGFVGVTDIHFITAGGVAAIRFGQVDRETFLKPHVESIRAKFQTA